MRRPLTEAPIAAEMARFQESVRGLAVETVRSIVRQELQRRIEVIAASLEAPPRARRRDRRPQPVIQPSLAGVDEAKEHSTGTTGAPPDDAGERKRRWTRDAIINELAGWLVSGTTIDASFVKRYGPRGLVAATRKEFGRFEAALNVASLQVSKMYPDGPPARATH